MEHPSPDRNALLAFAAIITFILLRSHPRTLRWGRSLGLDGLFQQRLQFLAFGLLFSDLGFGFLNESLVGRLDALVTLGLGVLGLLLGLDLGAPTTGQQGVRRAAVVESVATLALVAVPFFFLLGAVGGLSWQHRATAAALLGCTAAISGRRLFSSVLGSDTPPFAGLNRVADLSTVIGVLAAGTLLALLTPASGMTAYERLLALGVTGVVGGLAAWLLAGEIHQGALRTALLMGMVLVTAGTATHLELPPVAATLLMGLTIAHLPGPLATELRSSLAFVESPLRALLLVMAGAALAVPTAVSLIMVVLFLALRTAGKILGGRVASTFAKDLLPAHMGLGLLPSSAVAVGLALDFHATAPPDIAHIVVTVAVLGSILSETAGAWTTRALVKAHKLSDAAVDAVASAACPPETAKGEV